MVTAVSVPIGVNINIFARESLIFPGGRIFIFSMEYEKY